MTEAQIERLESLQRRLLKVAMVRCAGPERSDDEFYSKIRVPPVRTLLERHQLRWLGHLARLNECRIPLFMLSAVKRGGHPVAGGSAKRLCGHGGAYNNLIRKYLTGKAGRTNRTKYFKGSSVSWWELAQDRDAWRKFHRTVSVVK